MRGYKNIALTQITAKLEQNFVMILQSHLLVHIAPFIHASVAAGEEMAAVESQHAERNNGHHVILELGDRLSDKGNSVST
jgi:hypothetical protein